MLNWERTWQVVMEAVDETMRTKDGDSADKATSPSVSGAANAGVIMR
jgi:hypothetical protein